MQKGPQTWAFRYVGVSPEARNLLRGGHLKSLPFMGCGVERRLRRMQRDGAGAAVAECKRRHKARRMMRHRNLARAAPQARAEGAGGRFARRMPPCGRPGRAVRAAPRRPVPAWR